MSIAMITSIANLADAESRHYRFGAGVRRSIKARYHKARRADGRRLVQDEAQALIDAIAQEAKDVQAAQDAIRARYQKQWDDAWHDLYEQERARINMEDVLALELEEEMALFW
jgi:hypothetical protein